MSELAQELRDLQAVCERFGVDDDGALDRGAKRIEELEAERKWLASPAEFKATTLLCRKQKKQLERVRPILDYANIQADNAQIRLLNQDKELYNDHYWQSVLDKIRFDLQQALENKDETIPT